MGSGALPALMSSSFSLLSSSQTLATCSLGKNSSGWPGRTTAISMFLAPDSTTSRSACGRVRHTDEGTEAKRGRRRNEKVQKKKSPSLETLSEERRGAAVSNKRLGARCACAAYLGGEADGIDLAGGLVHLLLADRLAHRLLLLAARAAAALVLRAAAHAPCTQGGTTHTKKRRKKKKIVDRAQFRAIGMLHHARNPSIYIIGACKCTRICVHTHRVAKVMALEELGQRLGVLADRRGLPLEKCARGLCLEQLGRTVRIVPARSTHAHK
jgi:hypothetical protein